MTAMMKTSHKLGVVAALIFVLSHVLPAYADGSGFDCFGVAWDQLWRHGDDIHTGARLYYSGFAISNILFIGLVVALFVTKEGGKLRSVVSVVFFLHVLSWLILHLVQQPSQIAHIKIGYYVWLLAYGLLVAAHLWKKPGVEPLDSIPLAHSTT